MFSIDSIKFRIDRERFTIPTIKNLLNKLGTFICLTLNTFVTYLGLLIGFEVNTYCASLIPDINQLATWVIFVYI